MKIRAFAIVKKQWSAARDYPEIPSSGMGVG